MEDLEELKRQGLSIRAISRLTGLDRKTIQKYLIQPEVPVYGPRAAQPSKLDVFKSYLEQRMPAGVWNARVLLRELRARGYAGGYTILTDWLRPQRMSAAVTAVRRHHLGSRNWEGGEVRDLATGNTVAYITRRREKMPRCANSESRAMRGLTQLIGATNWDRAENDRRNSGVCWAEIALKPRRVKKFVAP